MILISYSSAPAGAGKTHQIVERACALASDHKRVLIIQPTKELINKTVEEELKRHRPSPPFRVFHQDTVSGSVTGNIVEYLKTAENAGQIVSATHQAFSRIPFFPNKHDWHVIVDEEMQVTKSWQITFPQTHHLLTDHIRLEQHNSIYSRVKPTSPTKMREMATNKDGDALLEQLKDAFSILSNKNWETFVDTEHYQRLLDGKIQRLTLHCVLSPRLFDGFASVLMTAANFEDTLTCNLWKTQVDFQEDKEFTASLRYSEHPNGNIVTIYYGFEQRWSRKYRNTVLGTDDRRTNFQRLVDKTVEMFGDGSFLWAANKDVNADDLFPSSEFPKATRLPNKPHGLNSYTNFHDIAFFSSLNPNTEHFRFLESQGISSEQARTAIYHAAAYQTVLRTSIRDPKSTVPARMIVPDRCCAEYLHQNFPGSRIERLDMGLPEPARKQPGRPRKHASNKARRAHQRELAKTKRIAMLNDLICQRFCQDSFVANCGNENDPTFGAKKDITSYTGFSPQPPSQNPELFVEDFNIAPCCGTVIANEYSSQPVAYLRWHDELKFLSTLHDYHQKEIASKEKDPMFSPAVFDPHRAVGTNRGEANIVYLRNVWLDFEDGDLKPAEFADLFPHLRMLITNSFNHTNEKPRFRVIIMTSQMITPDAYKDLYQQIADKLISAGYEVRKSKTKKKNPSKLQSGLDWSKKTPASIFYLPSQAQDPSQSFFHYYNDHGREPLDPLVWIKNAPIPLQPAIEFQPEVHVGPRKELDQARVDRAIQTWRMTPKGTGNDSFFMFAVELRSAGMKLGDIEILLNSEAGHAHSPKERRAQIKSIMKTLRKRITAS